MKVRRLVLAACVLAAAAAAAETPKAPATRLFVREGEEIVEYDLSTGRPVRTIQFPPDRTFGARISINRVGQVAIVLTPEAERARVWLWTGGEARLVTRPLPKEIKQDQLMHLGVDAQRTVRASLSADGQRLYWLTNDTRISRMVARGEGENRHHVPEIARTARVERTNLEGRGSVEIGVLSFPLCLCETAACEETCPEAEWWTPEDGITSSFFVTSWIPGQIGSTFLETRRFVEKAGRWQQERLPRAVKSFADVVSENVYIEEEPDGGCCAWVNVNSNTTTVVHDDSRQVVFDEWARVGNRNYDVSFFSWNARLSPDMSNVAHTVDVMVGGREGDEIRVGAKPDAKPDRQELQRISGAMRGLPAVELLSVDGTVQRRIAHRRLIGWRDSNRVVLLAGESVVIFDLRDGRELATGIRVRPEDRVHVEYWIDPSDRIWLR